MRIMQVGRPRPAKHMPASCRGLSSGMKHVPVPDGAGDGGMIYWRGTGPLRSSRSYSAGACVHWASEDPKERRTRESAAGDAARSTHNRWLAPIVPSVSIMKNDMRGSARRARLPSWITRPFVPCKYELYVSFLIVLLGTFQMLNMPQGFNDYLIFNGSLILGLVCAINAVLDLKRMHPIERIIAIPWCCLLLVATPYFFWCAANVRLIFYSLDLAPLCL